MTERPNFPNDPTGRIQVPYQVRARMAKQKGLPAPSMHHRWETRHFPIPKAYKRCPTCAGRTMLSVSRSYEHDAGYTTLEIARVCENCNGRGYLPSKQMRRQLKALGMDK